MFEKLSRISKNGLKIWQHLLGNSGPFFDTITLFFTLLAPSLSATVLIVLGLSLIPGTTLTAYGVYSLSVLSITSLVFWAIIAVRIYIEWIFYGKS